jgi:zinc finger SWIM domain-containing protein 3
MYDYLISLEHYRELRNLSHAACFKACQSIEAYQCLMVVLNAQANSKESTSDQKERISFGPVLPQTVQLDSDLEKVLDLMHVQDRGAPKKRL